MIIRNLVPGFGREVRVKGYFVNKPAPMLVSDLKWLNINTPIPESDYLLLGGKEVIDLPPDKLYGAEVIVAGKLGMRKAREVEIACKKFGDMVGL